MSDSGDAKKAGEILGNIFGVIITLGLISAIFLLCWNYGLCEVVDVDKIKYHQCFLLIIGWRCLMYKQEFNPT